MWPFQAGPHVALPTPPHAAGSQKVSYLRRNALMRSSYWALSREYTP